MGHELANPDWLVAKIAERQHGVVTIAQLLWAELTPRQVTLRVKAGRLHRIHRGVYAVGHRKLSREGTWMAAVLACGPEAALSHASAAQLWSLTPRSPPSSHVTVPGSAGRANRRGVVLHRSPTLTPGDVTRKKNIPVTTLARTQRDMGWSASFAADRRRDRELQALGFSVMRFADREVDVAPGAIAARLRPAA